MKFFDFTITLFVHIQMIFKQNSAISFDHVIFINYNIYFYFSLTHGTVMGSNNVFLIFINFQKIIKFQIFHLL
uniref:CSON005968 protein n=1 Tax=Culicoides sonorensis TaxID=179676 RepID=A0A336LAB6_CULSO